MPLNAFGMLEGYNEKYLTAEEKSVIVTNTVEKPNDDLHKEDQPKVSFNASVAPKIKVNVGKTIKEEVKKPSSLPAPKKFAELTKGHKVVIHSYGKRKMIDYIGIVNEDIKYYKDGRPKQIKIEITNARKNTEMVGKIILFLYAQVGKKIKTAWIIGQVGQNQNGEKIKKCYFHPYELEYEKAA